MRRCSECKDGIVYRSCYNQVIEITKFEDKINLIKREAPFEFGRMLTYHKT